MFCFSTERASVGVWQQPFGSLGDSATAAAATAAAAAHPSVQVPVSRKVTSACLALLYLLYLLYLLCCASRSHFPVLHQTCRWQGEIDSWALRPSIIPSPFLLALAGARLGPSSPPERRGAGGLADTPDDLTPPRNPGNMGRKKGGSCMADRCMTPTHSSDLVWPIVSSRGT